MEERKTRTCVHCNSEYPYDWFKGPSQDFQLCASCKEKTDEEKTPARLLWERIKKHQEHIQNAISVLDKEYQDIIKGMRSPKKVMLVSQQEAHEREHGVIWFGPRWRPDDFVDDESEPDAHPKVLFGVVTQPVLIKFDKGSS